MLHKPYSVLLLNKNSGIQCLFTGLLGLTDSKTDSHARATSCLTKFPAGVFGTPFASASHTPYQRSTFRSSVRVARKMPRALGKTSAPILSNAATFRFC